MIKTATYRYIIFLIFITANLSPVLAGNSNESPINFTQLYKYASLSKEAYQPSPVINQDASLKDYTITHSNSIEGFMVSYFIATNDKTKTQIVSIRGTSNTENALVDLALQLTLDKHTNIRLHDGFSQTAWAIYQEIKPQLKDNYIISTTGHSMGGAAALILAMHLKTDDYHLGDVVTFGQPKVTNLAGANKFSQLNVIRVVTTKDIVPLVPPFDPVDINNLDIYWHLGLEVILLEDENYAVTEGVESMLRAIKFTQEVISEENVKNHKISLYKNLIANKIDGSEQVPFESSFNLFNWL